MQPITIKHISQLSGYSISTVSKALNNGCDVSKQTKLKIRKLAKSNNYIPNRAALALRTKKTKIIAVIVPQINSMFYGSVLSVIQKSAFNIGYKVLLLQSFGCKKKELECINEVMDGCVDGIIVIKSSQKRDVTYNKASSINRIKFPISLIYIDAKLSINEYDTKYLGEKSLNKLLQQIN